LFVCLCVSYGYGGMASGAESCGSRGGESPPPPRTRGASAGGRRRKAEAYREVLRRIRGGGGALDDDELWAHFYSLPARLILFYLV
jgi:hypothetical protein